MPPHIIRLRIGVKPLINDIDLRLHSSLEEILDGGDHRAIIRCMPCNFTKNTYFLRLAHKGYFGNFIEFHCFKLMSDLSDLKR